MITNPGATEPAPAFITIEGRGCQAYNETAFRYFLDLERRRARRTERSVLVLLVKPRHEVAMSRAARARLLTRVLKALAESVREVDFVGWYREEAVAAAVLALAAPTTSDVCDRVRARVLHSLMNALTPDDYARIGMRVAVVARSPRM